MAERRLGILGGTFNPIHLGHLVLADAFRERLALDRVLFIPAGVKHGAKNVGSGKGSELATYIVEKGKPLITLVK